MTPRTRHLVHVTVVNITGTAVMTQLLCPGGVHIKRGTCPGLVRVTVWYARCVGHVTPRTYSVWVVSRREGDTVGDDLSHTSPRHVGHVQDHDRESEAPIRHAVLPLASGQWASHRSSNASGQNWWGIFARRRNARNFSVPIRMVPSARALKVCVYADTSSTTIVCFLQCAFKCALRASSPFSTHILPTVRLQCPSNNPAPDHPYSLCIRPFVSELS